MSYDLTPLLTGPVLIGIVVAHLALFLASWKINPLYLLACAFLVLAVLSTGPAFPGHIVAKYARVYCSFLMVVIGILRMRTGPLRATAKAMMALAIVYIMAGLWSGSPIWALFLKSFFFWAILAGIILAYDLRNPKELITGLRVISVMAGVGGMAMLGLALTKPEVSLLYGRLAVAGMCTNTVGANVVMGLLVCGYIALYDRSIVWRSYAFAAAGMLAATVVWTGSRTSLITAVVGLSVQVLATSRRRFAMIFLILAITVVPYFAIEWLGGQAGVQRLAFGVNTRSAVWARALSLTANAPIIGHGWLAAGGVTPAGVPYYNAHSSFLQALTETGILGLMVFIVCSTIIVNRTYRMVKAMRQHSSQPHQAILPLSLLIAISVGAMASSSTLLAVVSSTLFLGFAVGLIDRLPELTISEKKLALLRLAYQRRLWMGWGGPKPATPKA